MRMCSGGDQSSHPIVKIDGKKKYIKLDGKKNILN